MSKCPSNQGEIKTAALGKRSGKSVAKFCNTFKTNVPPAESPNKITSSGS